MGHVAHYKMLLLLPHHQHGREEAQPAAEKLIFDCPDCVAMGTLIFTK